MIGTRYRIPVLFPLPFPLMIGFAINAFEELLIVSHVSSFSSSSHCKNGLERRLQSGSAPEWNNETKVGRRGVFNIELSKQTAWSVSYFFSYI